MNTPPLKTAVLISGHMRTFDKCAISQIALVYRKFEQAGSVEFFISTVADEDAHKAKNFVELYGEDRVHIDIVAEQPDCIADLRSQGCALPDNWVKGRPYMREKYPISVHPQAVARQLWQLEQCWRFYLSIHPHPQHDVFIRCRPDLRFHSLELPSEVQKTDAFTPWWGRFDGINDRFAIMGSAAAAPYFTAYSAIRTILISGGDLHTESLLKRALHIAKVNPNDHLQTLFSTEKANGTRPPEISAEDLDHLVSK